MKRLLAFAVLVLGLASCQQDFDAPVQVGGEVDFQLSVAAPEIAGTRAGDVEGKEQAAKDSAYGAIDYLQGANWDDVNLRYSLEVYDVDEKGNVTSVDEEGNPVPVKDRLVYVVDEYQPVTFDLRLVPNRQYRFVVFADFVDGEVDPRAQQVANIDTEKTLGMHHVIGNTLENITLTEDGINKECTDAYFATQDITIVNSAAQPMTLKRPYGKLRVVATDLAELNLNVDPGKVVVTYNSEIPTSFNAITGEVDTRVVLNAFTANYAQTVVKESLADHYYTAGYDAEENKNDLGRHTHMTLFTDYIFAEKEGQTPHRFTMVVYDKSGAPIKETKFNTDIPVERNKLTTVIGNVLTTATEINITIDDNFSQPNIDRGVVFVSSLKELQEAIDACGQGTTIIILEADIVGDVNIKQQEGVNVVLSGNNHLFYGRININGDARSDKPETLKIEGINFKSNEVRDDYYFIYAPTKVNNRYNYSHNITVENCTFSSENFDEEVVGIKLHTTYNAVVKNCKAENIHTLAQFYSTDNETVIENVEVKNCKNGIALGNIAKAVIKGANIEAKGYGIRLDGEKTRKVAATIEKATINAFIPVNIRKMNDDACNVDVEFLGTENVLEGSVYEIAFCSNEYEENVAPENPVGTFRLQNAEEARAFYGNVNSFSAFDAAINSTNDPNADVVVENAIYNNGLGVEVERDVTIDFQNNEYNAGSNANSYWYALEITGEYDVNIVNANFTRAGIFAGENANVVFVNGTINHKPERTSRYIFCARSGATITVKDGTFTNDRAKNSFFWADAATIIVEGGNFGGVASNNKVVTTNGGQVIIKGGTFNFDPTAWLAPGYNAVKNGSNWEVTFGTAVDGATVLTGIENTTIDLAAGEYGAVTLGTLTNVTIKGSEDANVIFKTTADSVLENVTVEDVNFKYTGATTDFGVIINASATIDNLVLDDCSFVGNGEKKGRGIYGQNPNATITVKNCTFSNLGYPVYTMSAGGYASLVVEDCTFELIKSWAIMPQYNDYEGDLTVNNCTFTNCTGGLVKAGKFTADHTFTFTNNTITNSSEHPAKNWFTIDTSAASKVVDNNTKDGVAWAPADNEGLK